MKSTSVIINCGRGPVIDESALIRALEAGEIAAAGLDVLEQEPPAPDNPLLSMDNVLITPHAASATTRMRTETRRRNGREVAMALQGKWPMSCVNPPFCRDQRSSGGNLSPWNADPTGRQATAYQSIQGVSMQVAQAIAAILNKKASNLLLAIRLTHYRGRCRGDIRTIIVRQERVGLHMADAVSRLSSGDDIGVFVMQHGPGAENAFGGVPRLTVNLFRFW